MFERGSIHDDQAMLVKMLYDHFLNYDSEVCVVSLFDRVFIHDDKAKLVKFFTDKSLDYPDVAQVLFIRPTTCFSVFSPVPCPCSPLWTGRKSPPRPSARKRMPQSGRR